MKKMVEKAKDYQFEIQGTEAKEEAKSLLSNLECGYFNLSFLQKK